MRAVTAVWLFAGLRLDEVVRLRLGCVRWQPSAGEGGGSTTPGQGICWLDVPTNKTGTAFTKPVDRLVGETIGAWEAVRPAQPAMVHDKTGESVYLLFAYRCQP